MSDKRIVVLNIKNPSLVELAMRAGYKLIGIHKRRGMLYCTLGNKLMSCVNARRVILESVQFVDLLGNEVIL